MIVLTMAYWLGIANSQHLVVLDEFFSICMLLTISKKYALYLGGLFLMQSNQKQVSHLAVEWVSEWVSE